jgi:hypothetical protein
MSDTNELRIRVVIDNNECEVSYPLSQRDAVRYDDNESTLFCAVKAIKDIVEILKKEQ